MRSGSCLRVSVMVVGFVFLCCLATVLAANCDDIVRSTRRPVTNTTCKTDMDCMPAHSSCQRAHCFCKEGYLPINRTASNNFLCIPDDAKKEGDRCVDDLQCQQAMGYHGQCVMYPDGSPGERFGSCHCKPNHHLAGKLCYSTSYMGDACRLSNNCYLERNDGSVRTYCVKGVCYCPRGRHPSSDGKECVANEGIERPCADQDDCTSPHTRCVLGGFCYCDVGYVMNENMTVCEKEKTPPPKLGDPCTKTIQCSAFMRETRCHHVSKTCVCNIGTKQVNGTCYRIARLRDACYVRFECVDPSGEGRIDCIGNTCVCVKPYTPVGYDCLLQSELRGNSSPKLQVAALTLISWLLLL